MEILTAVLGTLAATIAATAAGVALRRRRARRGVHRAERPDSVDVAPFSWVGPFRNAAGEIEAMRPSEQRAWAAAQGGRLPTPAEFDAIYRAAEFKIRPSTHDVATTSMTELNKDAVAAGAKPGDSIAIGKTWVGGGSDRNYGWYPPPDEVSLPDENGKRFWRGIPVTPAVTGGGLFVIQPVSDAHQGQDHVDYSQIGYAVVG